MNVPLLALFIFSVLFLGGPASAADQAVSEGTCTPGSTAPDSSGICVGQEGTPAPLTGVGPLLIQTTVEPKQSELSVPGKKADRKLVPANPEQNPVVLYFFWGRGCPHCEEEKRFLAEMQSTHPLLEIRDYEVWYHKQNATLLASLLQARGIRAGGVPITFVDQEVFTGFTPQSRKGIAGLIETCGIRVCGDPGIVPAREAASDNRSPVPSIAAPAATRQKGEEGEFLDLPLAGMLDARTTSLPLLTLVIAGLDSFNPCAFFVLLTLLGLLVHAQSRNKMLLVGGIFVFFSGFVYFLFMAAWLNLFLVMGKVAVITTIAGSVSILIALINIKDFFIFKQGLSLTIPDSAKPKLFDRMRRLLHSTSLFSILIGTTVLALVANSYELLCTAGFPMVFTRILTLHALSPATYYFYLLLYNIVYVIPLFLIVLAFTITLGSRKLSEWQGRLLKLISGVMMLGLGSTLIINPALLNSVMMSLFILAGALGVSLLVATATRKLGY